MQNYGILSLLPPVVAVLIAWKSKNVLVALFSGAFVGTLIIFNGNPMSALVDLVRNYILVQTADSYNSNLLVMMIFIGGFVGVVTYSGGALAFAKFVVHAIGSRVMAQISTWLAGILVFFSDSASPLLVGSVFQPICDRMRVSREKLAWLLDSTASPVCILVPFIGWGIYIQGLIRKEFDALAMTTSEWDTFLQVIPFQFYAIGVLFMVPLVAFLGFEFSTMYKAEWRTRTTGQPFWPAAKLLRRPVEEEGAKIKNAKASLLLVPLVVLFATFVGILYPLGFPYKPVSGVMLRTALCTGYFLASLACVFLMVRQKVATPEEAYNFYIKGVQEVVFILLTLVLAWSLGSVCKSVGTAEYIVNLADGNIPAWSVPALLFITGGFISFATGSSWGAFAILFPIAIPMAHMLEAPMLVSIGAVLSGNLFGDHCSPISDTTILASMGAACDHLDHVKTQIPYAFTVALASLMAYVIAGFFPSVIVLGASLTFLTVLTILFSRMWGQRIPNYTLEDIMAEESSK